MPWFETPPFERGKTWMGQGSSPTFDPTDQVGTTGFYTPAVNLEGKVYMFPDTIYGTGVPVIVRCVRNNSGQAQANAGSGIVGTTACNLLPTRLVVFDPAYPRMRVCQHAATNYVQAFPVDELLPAAGVASGDLFYIVISGPALVNTSGTITALMYAGDQVAAATAPVAAATNGLTDGGGIAAIANLAALTGTGTLSPTLYANILGRVIGSTTSSFTSATTTGTTAATANNTNSGVVVMVESKW